MSGHAAKSSRIAIKLNLLHLTASPAAEAIAVSGSRHERNTAEPEGRRAMSKRLEELQPAACGRRDSAASPADPAVDELPDGSALGWEAALGETSPA